MQRRINGEVIITFKTAALKEKFLRLNSLRVGSESYAVQDIDRPLTYLTIYDAPFELADMAMIRRLSPFCEVLHFRRGRFDFAPGVCNGLRHYRVRVFKPIPIFLRFEKFLLFLKHQGQVPTCRRCNQPGHFSNQCTTKICFNCDGLGHETPACPAPTLCSICKSDNHLAKFCPYSWYSLPVLDPSTDESLLLDMNRTSNASYGIPELVRDLDISSDESDAEEPGEPVVQPVPSDPDPPPALDLPTVPDPSPASDSPPTPERVLDSQGFLNAPDPPDTDPAPRPRFQTVILLNLQLLLRS